MIPDWKRALDYPGHLPVSSAKESILQALSSHQVVILQSETGSGKSTQVPKMLAECLGQEQPLIGITQPRRLATKLLAQRLNQELSGGSARFVGWQIRFEKHTQKEQILKVMTEGVLWQEILHNPFLNKYDALILDEVHERSVTMDLILGALPRLLKKRPHFKLVLLSATLCGALFQKFFKNAAFLNLPGRSYPIDDVYCPAEIAAPLDKLLWAIDQAAELSGDVLVFCATEAEILFFEKNLKKLRPQWAYFCLYARMIHQQQKGLFQSCPQRKVILSTNVAETSVTLPGVRIVIDLGMQKILQFHPQYRVNSYPIIPISKQSITQRRGRAGRTQSGWCFHLYTEQDAQARPDALAPEIQRSSLSQVVLQILCLRQGPIEAFPFVSPPSPSQLREALKTLKLLGLVSSDDKITALGRKVARYPIDPRFCVILFEALECHCAYAVAIIVAFLSGDDPRVRPADQMEKADKAHLRYHDLRSDFMSVLNLWIEIQEQKNKSSKKGLKQYIEQHFLNPLALRSWELQVAQLSELFGIKPKELSPQMLEEDFFLIHQALLAGFFDRLYHKLPKKPGRTKHYQGTHGAVAYIHPSSVLKEARCEWVFAIVQQHDHHGQTRLRWVGPASLMAAQKYLAPHVTYQYSEPFYAPETGEVMVYKTGHAWGLAIIPAVAELYRLIDPEKSRQFLCEHKVKEWAAEHFQEVPSWHQAWQEAFELSSRARREGNLLADHEIADKIWASGLWPEFMTCQRDITRFKKTLPSLSPSFFLQEDLGLKKEDFPSLLVIGKHQITIDYDNAPEAEGFLHYTIPAACWRSEHPSRWLIAHPYFGVELIVSLLLQLPKKDRNQIGQLRECAIFFRQEFCGRQTLWSALVRFLFQYYDLSCSEKSFKVYDIPKYLIPHFWIQEKDRLDYLGCYHYDDDKLLHHHSVLTQNAPPLSPWEEVATSAAREIYRSYDEQTQQWSAFNHAQYWEWHALLLQQYALKIWEHAPAHIRRPSFPLSTEKAILYRGIYLGLTKRFEHTYIHSNIEFEQIAKENALFTQYLSFIKTMAVEFEPAVKKICLQKWPQAWLPLKEALEDKRWLGHTSFELFKRWPLWLKSLSIALEKVNRKEHLVQNWQEVFQSVCAQLGAQTLNVCDPLWAIALEGIVALFDPLSTPLFPWSEKKILKVAGQTNLWQKRLSGTRR